MTLGELKTFKENFPFNLTNAQSRTIQEISEDISGCINYIKSMGKKAGICIKPNTMPDAIRNLIDQISDI